MSRSTRMYNLAGGRSKQFDVDGEAQCRAPTPLCHAGSSQSVGPQDRVEFARLGGMGMAGDQSGGDAADGGSIGDFGGCLTVGGDQGLGGLFRAAVLPPGAGEVGVQAGLAFRGWRTAPVSSPVRLQCCRGVLECPVHAHLVQLYLCRGERGGVDGAGRPVVGLRHPRYDETCPPGGRVPISGPAMPPGPVTPPSRIMRSTGGASHAGPGDLDSLIRSCEKGNEVAGVRAPATCVPERRCPAGPGRGPGFVR